MKQLTFRGQIRSLNKSEYVTTFTEAYEANPNTYILEIRAAYRDFISLFDANMNNMLEIEEHVRLFKVFGRINNEAAKASFRIAYKTTESVPLDVVIDTWIRFRIGITTTTKNDSLDEAIKTALHEETVYNKREQ